MSETIAAISTAPGEGGIGIVRVSGESSKEIMSRVMDNFPDNVKPRNAYFGKVTDGKEIIDEAIFIYMESPSSYTGEDMLEIQAHGSNVSLKKILRAVLNCGAYGIRIAEPGEFTKIAFLNGKMDLSQAEAVIDIIKAKTDLSLEIAESQIEGRLGNSIRKMRENLLDILAKMAVNIDYPDEDIDQVVNDEFVNQIRWVLLDVDELLDTASIGRIAREGIKIAIVGKPNVGKSSLMNALLGEGRVIVTDIPGTTRDTVEESVSLGGIPIVLIDTAGIRDTDDRVEKKGIEKTEQAIASADMVMLVIDRSSDLEDEDNRIIKFVEKMNGEKILVVLNKSDLGESIDEDTIKKKISGVTVVTTALTEKKSLEAALKVSEAVGKMFGIGNINPSESNIVTNERQIQMLKNASMNLSDAITMLQNGESIEIAELSVHYAYDSLGKIIGEEAGEEILNTVFSKFCLGK
ncbi:MAG: tRNA uridine-5-carboxymethylaminomethyl(34) synthesis GTPase MnmE [Synergistaceae bacterium]|nr:tRNA uridine-5-carboxymethylaminomethyl(34) synthesis GTPase MnmE [Synergistaceae bacterium]NLY87320.1 tRNA uridine-5-carboxymethylaminomethyl(34) synthesis GTPase MnmE [Clostridiales bacterium]